VARKRAKHIKINDPSATPEIEANVRTVPGIITQRGCSYAGCKGVVFGPIADMVHITHGPVGCSYYSWGTRRNQCVTPEGGKNFLQYCFTTDMQEEEIVFGGEKKLRQAIQEAYDIFHPRAIAVYATCPVGLIGDDIHAVSRQMAEKLGIPVLPLSCEGYKGVSQSAGHHIANNRLFSDVIGGEDLDDVHPFTINILGEYNIGGDSLEIERVLNRCGITLQATLSGNVVYDDIARAHNANLNVVMCHRSINYIGEMMETKFGIPWIKVNFIGVEATAKSLRKIAQYFEDPELAARVEDVIAEEMAAVRPVLDEVTTRTKDRLAMLFVGGSRAHHYQELFKDLSMKTVAAGYEFAHRDDYEGRRVLPTIKVDADSRNIEELKVGQDEDRYRPRKTAAEAESLAERGLVLSEYEGLMSAMSDGTLVVDDISHHEMEQLIEAYHPDIFCSGIKDKYVVEKMGVPTKQLHNYDYGGPYAGFQGAINFYQEIDRMIGMPARSMVVAPWQRSPEIRARLVQPR
jgi:nitrogenase molybdenum-iron protein alpha chain